MGLGLFGGGVGAARYFAERGDRVTVTDLAGTESLRPSLAQLADLPDIRYVLGRHDEADIIEADLVVASPAVPPSAPLLRRRRASGRPITSEIQLLLERVRGPVLAVTGSNGKTTTTSMLADLLGRRGLKRVVGGNIGGSLLNEVESLDPETFIVLELSSFMLETLTLTSRPLVAAIVTNLSANHLDRHGDMASYKAAKMRLLEFMPPGAPLLLDQEDAHAQDWLRAAERSGLEGILVGPGEVESTPQPARLVGSFNHKNLAMAASLGERLLGRDDRALANCAREFQGLPHRLEVLGLIGTRGSMETRGSTGTQGSLIAVNDSKATTPFATAAAVSALEKPIRLIAGGYDKGIPADALIEAFEDCERVVLLGATAAALEAAWLRRSPRPGPSPELLRAETLEEAIELAAAQPSGESYLLFSPGHPSYDAYANFEQRGEAFARALRGRSDFSPASAAL